MSITHCPVCGRKYSFVDRFSNSAMCPACFNMKNKTKIELSPVPADDAMEPDSTIGIFVVILCAAILAAVLIIPSREGASPGGKLSLVGIALVWLGWGIRQILRAKHAKEKDADPDRQGTTRGM
jgi:hypothetical protein